MSRELSVDFFSIMGGVTLLMAILAYFTIQARGEASSGAFAIAGLAVVITIAGFAVTFRKKRQLFAKLQASTIRAECGW